MKFRRSSVEEPSPMVGGSGSIPGGEQSLQDQVIADLEKRKEIGLASYGTLLYTNNGRDMLNDLYEELLDACCYIAGVIKERDSGS